MAADSRVTGFLHNLSKPAFEPFLTGPLLYVLLKGPAQGQDLVLKVIEAIPGATVGKAISVLKWLFILGVVGRVNAWLNSWALNAWRLRSQKSNWNWNREVAVVTGGSSGIGAVIVRTLVKEGVRIAVVDIQPLPADMHKYRNIAFFQCDITKAEQVHEAGAAIRKKFGSPSILINNAGIGSSRSIMEHDDAFLHKIMGVNLISHFTTVKEFMPDMVKQNKGQIVTVASMASFVAVPGIADYAATKAGVLAFHEALNSELKHYHKTPGIITTSVHPNWVSTPLVQPFEKEVRASNGPLLRADDVGTAIANHVLSCSGGQLFFPQQLSRVSGIRGWPNWMQEALRDLVGRGAAPAMVRNKKANGTI